MTLRRLQPAFCLSLGLAVGILGLIFAAVGEWQLTLAGLALGSLWAWAHWRHRRRWGTGAFLGLVVLATLGTWQALSGPGMLLAATAALVSWDLDQCLSRWSGIMAVPAEASYVRSHLARLGLVAGGGLGLGGLALTVRLPLRFGVVVFLGLSGFAGLVWLATLARPVFSETEPND